MSPAQKFELALHAHRQGRLEQAEDIGRELIQHDPLDERACYLLGVLAIGRADDKAGLDLFAQAVGRASDGAAFHAAFQANLLISLRHAGRLEQASRSLLQAIAAKKDPNEVSHDLGLVLLEQGDTDSAIQCFERVAELKPEMFENQRQLARALALRGAVKRAVGHYHCALVLDPTSVEVMLELAQALAKLGRRPAAAALIRRARAVSEGA